MKTLFQYTHDPKSGRWIAISKPLGIFLECDSKEEMVSSIANGINALFKSGKKHRDIEQLLSRIKP